MTTFAAIPVEYKGVRFRSILEASWAQYFDSLGLQWFYEPEALQVSRNLGWLPDFALPELKLLVECKAWMGDGMGKVGQFVKTTKQDVLVCFPQGRFVLCSHYDWLAADMGKQAEGKVPDYLIAQNWVFIEHAMQSYSCLRTDKDGFATGFLNWGELSDAYTGYEPDYWNSMKDSVDENGKDARSYYWGGYSTWRQRGFIPSKFARAA